MKQIFKTKRILSAFLVAAMATVIAASGLLYRADNALDDALYQQEKVLDGNIFVIGIDARSLEELGPFHTWGRSYMAQAVDVLNSDPECRPAVIGIDVLYAGYTDEAEDTAYQVGLFSSDSESDNCRTAEAIVASLQIK